MLARYSSAKASPQQMTVTALLMASVAIGPKGAGIQNRTPVWRGSRWLWELMSFLFCENFPQMMYNHPCQELQVLPRWSSVSDLSVLQVFIIFSSLFCFLLRFWGWRSWCPLQIPLTRSEHLSFSFYDYHFLLQKIAIAILPADVWEIVLFPQTEIWL